MKEQEIVAFLIKENDEFRKLNDEHRSLDDLLVDIDRKRYLTPEEEIERKRIQKQKLGIRHARFVSFSSVLCRK